MSAPKKKKKVAAAATEERSEQIITLLAQLRLECDHNQRDFFQLVQLSQPRYLDLKEKDMK